MKLIYYSNAENQLFDLKKDPEELNSIENQALERNLVDELILQLGEHPDAITNRVETYNRNSFIEWKREQDRAQRTLCEDGYSDKIVGQSAKP